MQNSFFDYLKDLNFKIELPNHKEFCLLYFKKENSSLEEIKKKLNTK